MRSADLDDADREAAWIALKPISADGPDDADAVAVLTVLSRRAHPDDPRSRENVKPSAPFLAGLAAKGKAAVTACLDLDAFDRAAESMIAIVLTVCEAAHQDRHRFHR